MIAGKTSEIIFKLTYIHVQLLTNPHGDYDKSALYLCASFHKYI